MTNLTNCLLTCDKQSKLNKFRLKFGNLRLVSDEEWFRLISEQLYLGID